MGTYAINPLCYEPRSDQVFVSFSKLGVKGNVLEGLRHGHRRFRGAELREPHVYLHHRGTAGKDIGSQARVPCGPCTRGGQPGLGR